MKVSQFRKMIIRWAQAQKHVGDRQLAEAVEAFGHVLSKADKLTIASFVKKINETPSEKKNSLN